MSTAPSPSSPQPLDPEVQQLLEELRASGARPYYQCTPQEVRERVTRMRETMPPGPEVAAVSDFEIEGLDCPLAIRHYQATDGALDGVVLYFHGGGWVAGSIETSDAVCRALVLASGCDVMSVGYRLAPEHCFPAAVRDADAALEWLLDSYPHSRVVLMGDSAGGNLAAVLARHARDLGLGERVVLQVLVYPVTDHAMDTNSHAAHVDGLLLSSADMRWFWENYVPRESERSSPDASPLRASDLVGVPSAFIVVTEFDPLRDEGLAYARSLVEAGVEVIVDDYEGMIHGFFPLVGLLSAASHAVESIGATIAAAVAGTAA